MNQEVLGQECLLMLDIPAKGIDHISGYPWPGLVNLFSRCAIAFDWPCWLVKFAFVESPRWLKARALHRPSGCRSELAIALAFRLRLLRQIHCSIVVEKWVHWGSLT
jgi:hypothetical protein